MRQILFFRFLVLIVFLFPWSLSAGVQEQLLSSLRQHQAIEGDFDQVRFIKKVDVTLKSSGRFEIKREGGLRWEQAKPFYSLLTIDGKDITLEVQSAGKKVVEKDSNPVLYVFAQTFLSLMRGDLSPIKEQSSIDESTQGEKWTLRLTPKNKSMQEVIRFIEVKGDQFIRSLRIEEQSGNYMTIQFSQIKVQGQ